jgi:hypothetical protein
MTELDSFAFPEPRDDDDDDVAWVLQVGATEWHRGAYTEAVVWLRRGVEAANAAGNAFRAAELNAVAEAVIEQMGLSSEDVGAAMASAPSSERPGASDDLVTEVDEIDFIEGDAISPEEAWQSSVHPDDPLPSFELRLSDAPSLPPESEMEGGALEMSNEPDPIYEAPTLPPKHRPELTLDDESETVVPRAAPLPANVAHAPADDERAGEIDGVPLADCQGFEDLPEEGQLALARLARLVPLSVDEEVSGFGAVLVTRGAVAITPEIGDELGAMATKGDVVFTRGTLAEGTRLRVVATTERTEVALWSPEDLQRILSETPWVGDELRRIADRFQALAGATLGVLGERLDLSLRRAVTDRMEVKAFGPGETIVTEGVAVPGLHVVGAGRVELFAKDTDGAVVAEHHPGDFLFAECIMGASVAPFSARAGSGGALVLFAPRKITHELMTSVPLFLEALAS